MSLIAVLYSFVFINSVDGRSNGINANILEPKYTELSSKHKDSDYYRAEKCTDGDRSYDRVCQTRDVNDRYPWIQLDFGSKVEIHASGSAKMTIAPMALRSGLVTPGVMVPTMTV